MKKYLVYADTIWSGTSNVYPLEVDDSATIYDIDQQALDIAYDNFFSCKSVYDIAVEEKLDPENLSNLEACEEKIPQYIMYDFKEFSGTDDD